MNKTHIDRFLLTILILIIPISAGCQIGSYKTLDSRNITFLTMFFCDKNNGWLIGHPMVILHTSDGGINWTQQDKPIDPHNSGWNCTSLFSIDSKSAYISWYTNGIQDGITKLKKTIDSGKNWSDVIIKYKNDQIGFVISSICFPSQNVGYIAGSTFIMKTDNGGNIWRLQFDNTKFKDAHTKLSLKSMHFLDENTGIAVGNIYHLAMQEQIVNDACYLITNNGGETWSTYILPYKPSNYQYNINYTLNSIFYLDETTAYAVDSYGGIHKSTSSGGNWTRLRTSNTIKPLNSVFFLNPNIGFAVGDSGIVLKTINGGINWKEQFVGTFNGLSIIYFIDSLRGFIAGQGIFLKTTNGGTSWLPVDVKVELPSSYF